ncbi:MAG: CBS domain-containing protein [Desulfoplanes sp.]|nr:CBS domain-containing protein [Desulfoplanes sp.]
MYVGLKMLSDFVTVTPKTKIMDAEALMTKNRLWMLLVTEGDKLVGYVRKEDISAALPSIITSLEKHEINYLLSKLTIDQILRKDIKTISPDTEIEAAAAKMYEDNLAGLAVVNSKGKLIGYINRTVLLEVLVEEMGYRQGGSRIALEVEDRSGILNEVSGIIAQHGMSIISTGTFFHNDKRIIVVRIATDDPSQIAAALQDKGYTLVGPETFMHEWEG